MPLAPVIGRPVHRVPAADNMTNQSAPSRCPTADVAILRDATESNRRFLESEARFADTRERSTRAVTAELRQRWRSETVAERRRRISREMFESFAGTVRHGPFTGLVLPDDPWWGSADRASMLLGLYELEVLRLLTDATLHERRTFVDVGAADGYYAVGLLRTGRMDRAICFEASPDGQRTIQAMARRNGVADRLVVHGCADSGFASVLPADACAQSIVLVDIEGGEFDLLDPACLERLASAVVVVEIHHWVDDFARRYRALLERAAPWFRLLRLPSLPRDTTHLAELDELSDDNRALLCSEGRPAAMRFLVLVPRGRDIPAGCVA